MTKKLISIILLIVLFIAGCRAGATPIPEPEQPTEETPVEEQPQETPAAVTREETQTAPETAEVQTPETPAPEIEDTPPAEADTPAAQVEEPTATPDLTPIAIPTGPFPPVVVQTRPEPGQEQPLEAPVEIIFDQPMDRASVEEALTIEPEIGGQGALEWTDERTLQFAPAGGFERGEQYRLRLAETARSQEELTLQRPFELRFETAGFLEVANLQPAAGAGEVALDAAVTVMFNRPVAPLNAIEASESLPDPVTFDPAVAGQGTWLNTATYQFTPETGFQPATGYTARIPAGLTDVFGQAVLAEEVEWVFTTVSPAVAASLPAPNDLFVSPTPVISVAFNQLMDHESVEQNLVLIETAAGQAVPGQFEWVDQGIIPPAAPEAGFPGEAPGPPPAEGVVEEPDPIGVETVTFTPDEPLTPGGEYRIGLPQGVASREGAETRSDYSAAFTVSPQPQVVSTNPEDGEQFADIWQGLDITFNTPMNPDSLIWDETLIIDADVRATEVFSHWADNNMILTVGFPRRENQTYSVTLRPGLESRYGQPLAEATTITWQTLRRSPYVYLVSPKIATYNAYEEETYIYMTARNVSQVNFELYTLSVADFQTLTPQSNRGWQPGFEWDSFRPDEADLIGAWSQGVDPEQFVNYVYKVDVSQAVAGGEPLPSGLYYLEAFSNEEDFYDEARIGEQGPPRDRQLLIVSPYNLTVKQGDGDVLAWLTDLQTGRPVPDTSLTLIGPGGQTQSETTGEEGVALFTYELPPNTPDREVLVFAGDLDQPGADFAVSSNRWSAGIETYEFQNLHEPGGFYFARDYAGRLYTDRPLYRPGQTVYFKGIVRADDDARYMIPTGSEQAQVIIRDPQFREILNESFPLNEWGTFNSSLALDEEAGLGVYQVEVRYNFNEADGSGGIFYDNFNVAEYRKPEFLVEATTGEEAYAPGETIELTVETEFFTGGPVKDAPVRWTLLSDDYFFQYEGDGFYDFTNEVNSRADAFDPAFGFGFGQEIADGQGLTDENGRFSVEVPADITGQLTSQRFTFDVAVTGLNNQEVANQVQTIVHKGDYYVGLRPVQYVGRMGQSTEVEALVVDWDSRPVADQAVEVVFAREDWYSVRQRDPEGSRLSPDDRFYWENIVDTKAVFSTTVTTDQDGLAVAEFVPDSSGSYKVYARTVDEAGREIFSSTFIWISGSEYVNWGQQDHDRLELVADMPSYNTGDTATILVPHPYSGTVSALVTVERGHIYDHFVTELDSNSAQIEIPITAEMNPNAYVSVVIMQGGGPSGAPAAGEALEDAPSPPPSDAGEAESGPSPTPAAADETEDDEAAPSPTPAADETEDEEAAGEPSPTPAEDEDAESAAADDEAAAEMTAPTPPEDDEADTAAADDEAEESDSVDDETAESTPSAASTDVEETGGETPSFKIGYVRLNIDPEEKRLDIDLEPITAASEDGFYDAGQTVEYAIKVTDFQGEPVQAELSLALIDKAVLTLFPETPGQLFDAFWERRALEVQTGMGLTLALDRINRALDARKGGGGGDGMVGPDSVRRNFADTALWEAEVVTDENGEAVVEAVLPDNLTTWVLIAKGVSGDETLVGEARREIVAGKPLLVRTVTPRFFVVDDTARLGLIVQNNSEETLTVEPTFTAAGLDIEPVEADSPVTVEAGQEVKVEYDVVVEDVETVSLTMGAAAAEADYSDAVAFELPVYRLSTPETVATGGVLTEEGTRFEAVVLPANFEPGQGELLVDIEPSLAAGMRDGLDYLEHFPHESTEQIVSRFLPNIFTVRAYRNLELEGPALAQQLPRLVNIGGQRLVARQNMDGGWGWQAGSESDPFLTAYVLLGLIEAQAADFTVEQWVIDSAVDYLTKNFAAPTDIAAPWQANRQAFILYVLAEAGQGDLSRSVALFETREQLDMYGRAFLAMAMHLLDEEASQIETLISDLTSEAVAGATGAHWEDEQVDLRNMSSDIRSTAIVIAALTRIQPDHPLLPQAVRWLMTNREQRGHWATTQETAWAIIGLTDWLVASGELQADYAWQVALNGEQLGAGQVEAANLDETTGLQAEVETLLADAVNRLAIHRSASAADNGTGGEGGDEAGNLYYTAHLTYFKPVEAVTALERGIIVTRQYFLQEENGEAVTGAEVGDFITVKLTLVAPNDLRYVVIEDYLPAGVEAVDSSLATTSAVADAPQGRRQGVEEEDLWGRQYFTHTNLRDEKAVIYADYLPQGVYEYTYTVRASLPGEFHVIPTHAEQMYFPEVFGRSDGGLFTVR